MGGKKESVGKRWQDKMAGSEFCCRNFVATFFVEYFYAGFFVRFFKKIFYAGDIFCGIMVAPK